MMDEEGSEYPLERGRARWSLDLCNPCIFPTEAPCAKGRQSDLQDQQACCGDVYFPLCLQAGSLCACDTTWADKGNSHLFSLLSHQQAYSCRGRLAVGCCDPSLTRGLGVSWCVGSCHLVVGGTCACQPAELLPVFSHQQPI